jgi:hypothetical protein
MKTNTLLLIILWAVITAPLWAGAEEQPATDQQNPAAQAVAADSPNPAAIKAPAATAEVDGTKAEEPAKPETFASIELDRFIEQEQKAAEKGKKMIKMMVPLSFEAKLKRQPEEKQMEYVYTALELSGVKPIPEVHHRMFIESGEGRIIPVYIEANAVKKVNNSLKEEDKARFQGYHVYSYAKGPAILVVDFAAIP